MQHDVRATACNAFPESWRLGWTLERRRRDDLLVGGFPTRVVRLDSTTATVVDCLEAGSTVAAATAAIGVDAGPIARRLVAQGFAWADPDLGTDVGESFAAEGVTIVVPALDAAAELPILLGGSGPAGAAGRRIVVDDGSTDETRAVAERLGADVVTHATPRGPAAARNTGWRHATTPIVLFADADTVLPADWAPALAHFADPSVAAVVPRVLPATRTGTPTSIAEAYETVRFVYDLGEQAGNVGPDQRLRYAATALLFVRRDALIDVGGLSDDLRYGEDLDLVLRLVRAGWTVRYEPRCVGSHRVREHLWPLLRLHHNYGTPHATINRRLGRGAGVGTTTLAAAGAASLVVAGRPLTAAVAMGAGLVARTVSVGRHVPLSMAAPLAARTEIGALRTVGAAATAPWLPLALLVGGRPRRGLAAILVIAAARHLSEWRRLRPPIGPNTWFLLRMADDQAVASGVWRGCVRARTAAPLLPRVLRLRATAARREYALDAGDGLRGWQVLAVLGWVRT